MVRRIADGCCQRAELRHLFGMLDQFDRPRNRFTIAPDLVRLAAQAGAISGRPRLVTSGEELDMLSFGPLGGTTRLAVNAGRLDGTDHSPVPSAVAAHESRPGGVRVEVRDVVHPFGSTLLNVRCKRPHCQFFSIFAEKHPRAALWAWMVSMVGSLNSLRIPASASPGEVIIAAAIIPSSSKPRSERTRFSNTGGTWSTYAAGRSSASVTKMAWVAR